MLLNLLLMGKLTIHGHFPRYVKLPEGSSICHCFGKFKHCVKVRAVPRVFHHSTTINFALCIADWWLSDLLKRLLFLGNNIIPVTGDPLVNVYITMERFTIFYGKIHYFDWVMFYRKLFVYQGVQENKKT